MTGVPRHSLYRSPQDGIQTPSGPRHGAHLGFPVFDLFAH